MWENICSELEQSSGLEAVVELEAEQRITNVMVENLKQLQMCPKDKTEFFKTQLKLELKKRKKKSTGKM
ncbi:hypothetical protein DPMN_156915 [Dreissena polymorpha]|uniref:Uncharacterized protein n=1 Tax=Dreissena polymorpha TaxID=45954 RepID=A0A9D4FPT3_DREPO|nr:hypothetical protein DPMN_156915 [Dreissena polymorpha]